MLKGYTSDVVENWEQLRARGHSHSPNKMLSSASANAQTAHANALMARANALIAHASKLTARANVLTARANENDSSCEARGPVPLGFRGLAEISDPIIDNGEDERTGGMKLISSSTA